MKKTHWLIVSFLTFCGAFSLMFLYHGERGADEDIHRQVVDVEPMAKQETMPPALVTPEPTPTVIGSIEPNRNPLSAFKNAVVDHPAGVDPMIVFALEEFSDEQVAAYNDLHVIPYNRAVGKECEETVDLTLESIAPNSPISQCRTVREHLPHPYMEIPIESLEELAEFDAAAANIMALRVAGDSEARNEWYLRAAALSGKTGPILELANRRYGSTTTYKKNAEGKLEVVASLPALKYRAVLETIAAKLGDPRANPSLWRDRIVAEAGPEELDSVEGQVLATMNEMAVIQRDVTGSTQVQEAIDA